MGRQQLQGAYCLPGKPEFEFWYAQHSKLLKKIFFSNCENQGKKLIIKISKTFGGGLEFIVVPSIYSKNIIIYLFFLFWYSHSLDVCMYMKGINRSSICPYINKHGIFHTVMNTSFNTLIYVFVFVLLHEFQIFIFCKIIFLWLIEKKYLR